MGNCCINSGTKEIPNYPNWMGELPVQLQHVPLNTIAIPGSHDTTASYLNENAPLGPDADSFLKDICKFFSEARKVVYNWSKTQSLCYMQQLEAGVRYFDLRISTMVGTEDLYLVHGMYSYKVEQMVNTVKQYLDNHPKEIVLLDFNHFYGMTIDQHQWCLNMLMQVFGEKLCPFLDMESVTLSTLWKNKLQVLVFYQNKAAENNMLFWPGNQIPSPWPNIPLPLPLIKYLDKNYVAGRDMSTFYVTQGVLTPDKSEVLEHFTATLKSVCSIKCDADFVKWLASKKAGKNGINICIMDFVELSSYIPTLMNLNHTYAVELLS